MTHGKNVNPKPKCSSTCLECTHKISKSLDKKQAFYDQMNKAIAQMNTCSISLGQINFLIRHNLQFNNHKKVDIMRNTMQKIGDYLMHFSFLNDFLKFGIKMKSKHEASMKM
jgi:hypothetical protein